ncbi:MAG: lysophospholipase [Acidimicrobiia bacterium]|nr:lysophospholipase [Acidimicrobiia bacterium]
MASQTRTIETPAGSRLSREWPEPNEPWASMLIVHGLGEHSGRYERVGDQLSAAGIRVRSFDLPGFGSSAGTRAYVEEFGHFTDAVAEELGHLVAEPIPTVLLGHSLGGLIAYRYATSHHLVPDFLVLSAPALDANAPAWQRAAAPLLAKVLPKMSMPNPIAGEQLSRDPAVGEAYFADPLVHTKMTNRLGAEILETMESVASSAPPTMPTLVIHGGADTIVPARFSAHLADTTERKLYAQLRHELFNEPEGPEVVADVIAWLRRQIDAPAAL